MPEALWQSWSQKGRVVASMLLKIPVEGVLPTTNHLESFNGVLKGKHIPQWAHSRSRLRVDFLICILITKILPGIFSQRKSLQDYSVWLHNRFQSHAGGVDLTARVQNPTSHENSPTNANLCWWEHNKSRDDEAAAIVSLKRIYWVRQHYNLNQFEATCASSRASLADANHPRYQVYIHRDGTAACTCPDFTQRGGACKHLRALRLMIENWVTQERITPFYYPTSSTAARRIRSFHSVVQTTPTIMAPALDIAPSAVAACVLQNAILLQELAGGDKTDESTGDDKEREKGGDDEVNKESEGVADDGVNKESEMLAVRLFF